MAHPDVQDEQRLTAKGRATRDRIVQAAAQLIVREAGGLISFPHYTDRLGAPLDLVPHSPIVAARSTTGLAELEGVCRLR